MINDIYVLFINKMFISALMTIASFLGLFLIHYQNVTVYNKQLLIEAPPAPFINSTILPSIESIDLDVVEPPAFDYIESIDLDLVEYDEVEEEVLAVAPTVVVSDVSLIISLLPLCFITTYIIALMFVQSKITATRLAV